MKRTVKVLALILALLLSGCLAALAEPGAPSTPPTLLRNPQDVTVKEGGKCVFTISQTGAQGITWRLYNPVTGETVLCTNAGSRFPGLSVNGKNGETLTLTNVPASLNGWQTYCTLSSNTGVTVTRYANITVVDSKGRPLPGGTAPTAAPAPAPAAGAEKPADDGYIHVKAIGCKLQVLDKNGKPAGAEESELIFRNCADFRVTCTENNVEFWIINGVKYKFEIFPRNITVIGLTEDITFECCNKKNTPKTLLSEADIQAARTGETLVVSAEGAKLCHIKGNNNGAGGYFESFDFTSDFKNRATDKNEKGGRVTLKVTSKNGVSQYKYWKFNGADFLLPSAITHFYVYDLNTSMTFAPVTTKAQPSGNSERVTAREAAGGPPPQTPVTMEQLSGIMCSVTCTGCTFSCGGFDSGTQGYVPFGSQVTITAPAGKTLVMNGTPCGNSITVTVYTNIKAEAK
ncbi:MAG: hypothetical protein CW338_03405 [Clostridiales bacterium]|nr:hypothetical protein [Clostridiales bacterium]